MRSRLLYSASDLLPDLVVLRSHISEELVHKIMSLGNEDRLVKVFAVYNDSYVIPSLFFNTSKVALIVLKNFHLG